MYEGRIHTKCCFEAAMFEGKINEEGAAQNGFLKEEKKFDD
ncbi:hypothetical protein [Aureivirga marina]|nr:hypothetical protein [Aureivirga marina]